MGFEMELFELSQILCISTVQSCNAFSLITTPFLVNNYGVDHLDTTTFVQTK